MNVDIVYTLVRNTTTRYLAILKHSNLQMGTRESSAQFDWFRERLRYLNDAYEEAAKSGDPKARD